MSEAAVATGMEDLAVSMKSFMGGLESQLGRSLAPLKDLSEEVGGSKFGKNIKAFGKSMKELGKSNIATWKLEQMMKLLEPFLDLLKLFEIPINVLAALLQMFVNEIFVDLLPMFLELSLFLLELSPIFKFLGEIVGKVLVTAFNRVIFITKVMIQIWKEIFLFLGEKFAPIWEKLKAGFMVVWEFLKGIFLPMWNGIKLAFAVIKKAWDDSGGKIFGEDGFIALAFEGLMTFGKAIVNGFIGTINNVIGVINKIPGVDINTIPMLAQGGIVTAPTLAMIGDNASGVERVQPLENGGFGKEAQILSGIEETNRLLARMLRQSQEKARFEGFG